MELESQCGNMYMHRSIQDFPKMQNHAKTTFKVSPYWIFTRCSFRIVTIIYLFYNNNHLNKQPSSSDDSSSAAAAARPWRLQPPLPASSRSSRVQCAKTGVAAVVFAASSSARPTGYCPRDSELAAVAARRSPGVRTRADEHSPAGRGRLGAHGVESSETWMERPAGRSERVGRLARSSRTLRILGMVNEEL